ncbi:ParB/RepB/Spo0J family partition protein [Sulfobacillus thermosulfidooxidans]|uniref:ParB/RepB/Spo0J family partition protein n=1 Tax=Sulfobacillus thermosulfidooxidans TaxID=28034 RepID=UPI0006B4FF3B|nr:ParB/RepB/Spo0J family partition protein [Sulfobacillus thermosulfidooxidans]
MLSRDNTVKMLREFVELVLDDTTRRQLAQTWAITDADIATPRRFATTVVTHHREKLLQAIAENDRLDTQWKAYQHDGLAGVQALWESERRLRRQMDKGPSSSLRSIAAPVSSTDNESPTPLSETSVTTIEAVKAVAEAPIQEVPLATIVVRDVNVRLNIEDDPSFSELVTSIEQHGLLQPVVVTPDGDTPGQWRLLAGERRYRAVKTLGWTTILARIVDVPESAWKIVMLTENVQRQDLAPWEEALGYQQLLDSGLSLRQLAKQLHKSPAYLSGLLKLIRNPLIREAMRDHRLDTRSLALELAPLIDTDGHEKIPNTIESVLQFIVTKRPTVTQLREYITERLAEPSPLSSKTSPPQKSRAARGSFLKKEVARLEDIQKTRIARLSPEELAVLADLYDRTARALRERLGNSSTPDESTPGSS